MASRLAQLAAKVNAAQAAAGVNQGSSLTLWPNHPTGGLIQLKITDITINEDAKFKYQIWKDNKKVGDAELDAYSVKFTYEYDNDDGSTRKLSMYPLTIPYDISTVKDPKTLDRIENTRADLNGQITGLLGAPIVDFVAALNQVKGDVAAAVEQGDPIWVEVLTKFRKWESTNAKDGTKSSGESGSEHIQRVISGPAIAADPDAGTTTDGDTETADEAAAREEAEAAALAEQEAAEAAAADAAVKAATKKAEAAAKAKAAAKPPAAARRR